MKRALFLRYLLIGALSAAAASVVSHMRETFSPAFWMWAVAAAAIITGIAAIMAYRGASTLVESIDSLNEELDLHGEQMSFVRLPETDYPEIIALQGNIRKLCGKIIAGRRKLRHQQEEFDFIVDNMQEGILITDFSGVIVSCNKKAASVLGIPEKCEQKKIRDVLQEQAILRAVREAADLNHPSAFDLQAVDGSIYLLTVGSISEELSDESSLPRKRLIVISLTDVTAERSARNRQQEFFSNASHELKTPVTSIRGFSELLESGIITDPEKIQDSIRIIRREADRIDRIISDLLMISSLEDPAQSGEPVPVNVAELLCDIRDSLLLSMEEKNITLEISGGNFTIPAVYEHMHNLFGNLMQNAVKYNVENGKVWVRAETDGQYLYATVKDTGIGIPDEMKSRVFERFFRVDKGRSRSVGGTGLGLSIVNHIVSLYDGSIRLESKLGEGTTITAKLAIGNST
ncbi:MAG: PAS domain-containing protein [Oscillospiraceae bacterium]|nr:PAS domain-containing protein [Oscillospiraceae bacterium]